MKKLKKLSLIILCAFITFSTSIIKSNAFDFTSEHITVKNDLSATEKKLYPVLILKNNTDKDLLVTYDFYIHKTDHDEFDGEILVKANRSTVLELPQLHHLGETRESRTIWFSWLANTKGKPLQAQIETAIFTNPVTNPDMELGLN